MITVDRREVTEHEEILDLLTIPYMVDTLDAADFAFLDRDSEAEGIERSEIGNLVQKLRSGELEEQLYKCRDSYAHVILLAEGVYDKVDGLLTVNKHSSRGYFRTHIYPHTRYSDIMAMIVRLSEMGVEVIPSPNFECSIATIEAIYHQRTKPEEEHHLFKRIRPINMPTKLSSNPAVPRLMALASRMPEKVAIKLIEKYGTIWNILNTPDDELLEIGGLGSGLLMKLKQGVGKE